MARAATENYDWGDPLLIEFNEEDKVYQISYYTSQDEIDFLGERGLDLNCNTGEITFWPAE